MSSMQEAMAAIKTQIGVDCPYCNNKAALVKGAVIYPHRPDLKDLNFWHCAPCKAYVGCYRPNPKFGHTGIEPLGRLANAALRRAKNHAHDAFDWIWEDGHVTRTAAYSWLAEKLGISVDDCHIGMFDVEMCKRAEEICDAHLEELVGG